MNDVTHKAFHQVVTRVVISTREVLLREARENIKDPGLQLINGQCHRKFWIQNRKDGLGIRMRKHFTNLQVGLRIRNHRARIHFRARSRHRQHTAKRHDFDTWCHIFVAQEVAIPRIFITIDRYSDRLGIVTARTSTHSEEEVHLAFASNTHAVTQFVRSGVASHRHLRQSSCRALSGASPPCRRDHSF